VIQLPAGEKLGDHQVHERATLLVTDGEVEIDADGETVNRRCRVAQRLDPQ